MSEKNYKNNVVQPCFKCGENNAAIRKESDYAYCEKCFKNIVKDYSFSVYRYIPFDSFVDLILTNTASMALPSSWDDSYEEYIYSLYIKAYELGILDPMHFREIIAKRDKYYCQCWTIIPENAAMWSAYSFNSKAIRIEANLLDFFLMGFGIEFVQYIDEMNINELINSLNYEGTKYFSKEELAIKHMLGFLHEICPSDSCFESINIRKLLAIKRMEYSHENEIRIYKDIYFGNDKQLQKERFKFLNQIYRKEPVYRSNLPKYYKFPLDEASIWLKSICFHPNSNKYYQDIVKNFINRMGLKIPIKLSKLSEKPF